MNMTAIILLMLKASIMLSVFAIGLKATFADATFLFRRPSHLLRALLSMNVLMPLAAWALAAPFDLHPAVKITLLVISRIADPADPSEKGAQGRRDRSLHNRAAGSGRTSLDHRRPAQSGDV